MLDPVEADESVFPVSRDRVSSHTEANFVLLHNVRDARRTEGARIVILP